MKYLSFLLFTFFSVHIYAQREHACARNKQQAYQVQFQQSYFKKSQPSPQITHEMRYDMKFVHLNLNVERNTKTISGNARMIAKVIAPVLDTFMAILHKNLVVDSVYFNGSKISFIRQDSMVKAGVSPTLATGATFTSQVYYKGTPPNGGSAIGSGFSNGTSGSWGNQATWSLSQAFVAYHWWPTKQVLTDKIDSSWVYITTDSLNMAGSNGILTNVVKTGSKKRFEWKSRYPIDYYLISVAVAKYKEYNLYAKPKYFGGDSILIQNFIYDNAINNPGWQSQKNDLNKLPQQLEFLSDLYGMYPFHKEKYGNCMAPFSGGMEHQTMTSQGFFDYYIDAHELGHQWWGDNVTCRSWGDIWLNEGFASYTEHLVAEYLDPLNFQPNLYAVHANVMSQPGGSVFFTNNDTMNTQRIFSGRLTYDKGGAIVHSLRFLTNNDSLWFNTLRGFQNMYQDSTASAVDFQNYYQAQTSINPAVFFNQWYYGQGYPTFNVKYNFNGSQVFIRTQQTTSMPSVTPLFDTPLEYSISRSGKADTVIRVMHSQAIENYTLAVPGTITGVICDPNNWIINKDLVARDYTLGIVLNPVGLSENNFEESFSVAPNPAQNQIHISGSARLSGFQLFDIKGILIFQTVVKNGEIVDIQRIPAGIYLVKLTDSQGLTLLEQKLIKL